MSLPNSSEHLWNAASTISHQDRQVAIRCIQGVMTPIQPAVINGLPEEVEELIGPTLRSGRVAHEELFARYIRTMSRFFLYEPIQPEVINGLPEEVEELIASNRLSARVAHEELLARCGLRNMLRLGMIMGMNMRPLCDDEDYPSMTPIQTAVINGLPEKVKELIAENPRSVQVFTAEGETLFHLAVKHSQVDVFLVLLKKIVDPGIRAYLLNCQDKEGNTILHLAISNRLVEVVKLLLPENSTSDHLVGVNFPNKKGLTAWDLLCGEDDRQGIARRARKTLLEAPAVHLEEMHVQVAFVGILAATSIGIVCNIPSSFSTGDAGGGFFEAADVVAGRLPPILYLMVLNNAVVAVSLGATVKEMWKLPFKPVLLFVSTTIIFVYALLVDHVIPKFWVRIGSLNVVSSAMVWLLAGAYVASPAIAYYAVSYGFRYLIRLIKPLISKVKRELRFRGNGHILP